MDNFKPTNKKPVGKMSKKMEKNFSDQLDAGGVQLTEVDNQLNEKEQSLKKKIWDLSKMESLVHSDPKLSAKYHEMAEDGEEKYGYHYNETIMNILFNDYVMNSSKYLEKYKNAIPADKKRRDKSGIEQLEKKGKEKMEKRASNKDDANENDVPIHNNSLEGVIEENPMDNNLNRDGGGTFDDREYLNHRIEKNYDTMGETTTAASSGSYSPALGAKAKDNVYEEVINTNTREGKIRYIKDAIYTMYGAREEHPNFNELSDDDINKLYNKYKQDLRYAGKVTHNTFSEGENTDLESVKKEAQKISSEEGVAQHVNDIGNGNYKISDWFDSDSTIVSYENGRPLNEDKRKDDPCWDDYKQVGMKKKDGKEVPNCVPESENKGKVNELHGEYDAEKEMEKAEYDSDFGKDPSWDQLDQLEKGQNKEENIDETTTSSSSGQYATPIAWAGDKKGSRFSNKPAWSGGEIVGENYIINADFFQTLIEAINEGMNSPNDFSRVPMAEHHLHTREDKIKFIVDNSNGNFSPEVLKDVTDKGIDAIYRDLESKMGVGEGENIEEKSVSKNQQQFMGMVHAYKKGELDNPSDEVKKAAASMSDEDAKDFASTKHKGLPTKVEEDEDKDETAVSQSIKHDDMLSLATELDNAPAEEEENIVNRFLKIKNISRQALTNRIKEVINKRYAGSESPDYYKLEYIITVLNDMMDVDVDAAKIQRKVDAMSKYYQTPAGKRELADKGLNYQTGMQQYKQKLGLGEGILTQQPDTMSMAGDNPTTMAKTMKDVQMGMGESADLDNDDKIDTPTHQNELSDFGTSNQGYGGFNGKGAGTTPNYKNPEAMGAPKKMNEDHPHGTCDNCGSPLNEDGHCRRDEVPVAGKIAGEKGSCKKKKSGHENTAADDNKYNVKARQKREKERIDRIEKKKDDYKKELEKNKKDMKKLKEMVDNIANSINEDKKTSSMVNKDRLGKENEKNFKSDLKDSNTSNILDMNNEMMAKDQVEEVGDNPYELAEKIEAEKMKEHGFNSFDNEGNSTNDNNKEIPKRNLTDEEANDVMLNRGLGMQDIVYDNKPDERFEERMEKDMGEDIYKQRQEKMKYRSEAPMYNKDTQPTDDDSVEKDQFEKNISKFNSRKGVDENRTLNGRYVNEFNKQKTLTFKLSDVKQVKTLSEGTVKINLTGMGNGYTQMVNEDTSMRDLMNQFDFYVNTLNGKVEAISNGASKQTLTENKKEEKNPLNETVQKMLKLSNYDPKSYVDTNNIKKNRGF